jgi:septal ring-binding cell division protein DamX
MSPDPAPTPAPAESRISGNVRLVLGFVAGALFALTPMYYYSKGREAALRDATAAQGETPVAVVEPLRPADEPPRGGRNAGKAFASRMTYELSRLPEEPVVVAVKAPPVVTAALPPAEDIESARIANARPISAVPPQPRDRTQAIEREGQNAEYREPPRQQAQSPQPRVIEGREVQLKAPKLPDTPTRPIVADASVNTRAEIEAERSRLSAEVARAWPMPRDGEGARKGADTRTLVAVAPPVAGATPITRPPEAAPRRDVDAKPATGSPPGSNGSTPTAAASDVQHRLMATREWLAAAPQTTHTIQLMGSSSEDQLKGQLKVLSKTLEPSKLFMFRTVAQGKPSITLVYGAYADRQAALQALEKLPAALTANKPVLRTVNGIRAEMKQHKTSSESENLLSAGKPTF